MALRPAVCAVLALPALLLMGCEEVVVEIGNTEESCGACWENQGGNCWITCTKECLNARDEVDCVHRFIGGRWCKPEEAVNGTTKKAALVVPENCGCKSPATCYVPKWSQEEQCQQFSHKKTCMAQEESSWCPGSKDWTVCTCPAPNNCVVPNW